MISVTFSGDNDRIVSEAAYQYDYGQTLEINGLDLSALVEIDFSADGDNETITMTGTTTDSVTTVDIPNDMFQKSWKWDYKVHAYIYVVDETSGITVKHIVIPVRHREERSEEEPTPAQQSALDTAIAAMQAYSIEIDDTLSVEGDAADAAATGDAVADLSSEIFNHNYMVFQKSIGTMVFEQVDSDNGGLYLKIPGVWWFRGGPSYPASITYENITGIDKVTSPSGVEDCIFIAHNYALIYNISTQVVSVVTIAEATGDNIYLLFAVALENGKGTYTNRDGVVAGLGKWVYDAYQDYLGGDTSMMFVAGYTEPYFEYAAGNFYAKIPGTWKIRGEVSVTTTYDDIISGLPSTYVRTSPLGVADCIYIPSGYAVYLSKYTKTVIVENYTLAAFHGHLPVFLPSMDAITGRIMIGGGIGKPLFDQWYSDNNISADAGWDTGTLDSNGINRETTYDLFSKRIVSGFLLVGKGTTVNAIDASSNYYVHVYDLDRVFSTSSGSWQTYTKTWIAEQDCYIRIVARYSDDTEITSDNIDALIATIVVLYRDPTTISLDNADGIPSYFETQLATKIPEIRDNMNSAGQDGDTFIFITDMHYDPYDTSLTRNARKSGKLIKKIVEETGIKKIINGGDFFTGNDDPEVEYDVLATLFNDLDVKNTFHYPIMGNHDWNHYNTPTGEWDNATAYAQIIKRCEQYVTMGDDLTYYFDVSAIKTRYIMLNSYDQGDTIPDEQIAWFNDVLDATPTGYRILVFMHIWYNSSDWSADPIVLYLTTQGEQITAICDDFNSNNSDKQVIALIGGHCHLDRNFATDGGIPIILTDCDAYLSTFSSDNAPNTTGEQCFDVITVDYGNSTINCVRIGRGDDRTITY